MDSWFSDQGDRTVLSESNDMLQEVFLASYKRISVKMKYRLKQDFFISFQKKDFIPLEGSKKSRLSTWGRIKFNSEK